MCAHFTQNTIKESRRLLCPFCFFVSVNNGVVVCYITCTDSLLNGSYFIIIIIIIGETALSCLCSPVTLWPSYTPRHQVTFLSPFMTHMWRYSNLPQKRCPFSTLLSFENSQKSAGPKSGECGDDPGQRCLFLLKTAMLKVKNGLACCRSEESMRISPHLSLLVPHDINKPFKHLHIECLCIQIQSG
jgi:hypothetical protein